MNTVEMLDELQNKALHDERLKYRFLKTKEEEDALGAFCRVCREMGYEICSGEIAYSEGVDR